jgi:hypothetical protein
MPGCVPGDTSAWLWTRARNSGSKPSLTIVLQYASRALELLLWLITCLTMVRPSEEASAPELCVDCVEWNQGTSSVLIK